MIERIEINLLPVEYRVHHKKIEIKREIAYPLIGVGIVALGLSLFTVGINNSVWILRNQIKIVQGSIEQNRPIQNEINQLRTDNQSIQGKIKALELINVNREKWVKLMEEFSERLPEFTWLVSIKEEVNESPVIHLEGRTYSFPEVANYMSNLKECESILSVDLSQIEQIDDKNKLYRFAISCSLNPDAYLRQEKSIPEMAAVQTGKRK